LYQLYSNYGRKFAQSNRQIPNYSRSSTFSKTIQGLFQFSETQGLSKAGLVFKAGAGTLFFIHGIGKMFLWWSSVID